MKVSIVTVLVLLPCLSLSMIMPARGGRRMGGLFSVADVDYNSYVRGPGGIMYQVDTPDPVDYSDQLILGGPFGRPGGFDPLYYDHYDSPTGRSSRRGMSGARRRHYV